MAGTPKAKPLQPPRCRVCVSRGLKVSKEAWDGPPLPTTTPASSSSSTAPQALHKRQPRELSCDQPPIRPRGAAISGDPNPVTGSASLTEAPYVKPRSRDEARPPGELLAPYKDPQCAEPSAPAALRSNHNSTREAAQLLPERMQVTGGIKTDSKELTVDVVDQESHRGYSPSVVGRKFVRKSSHFICCQNSGCAGLGFLHGGQSETITEKL